MKKLVGNFIAEITNRTAILIDLFLLIPLGIILLIAAKRINFYIFWRFTHWLIGTQIFQSTAINHVKLLQRIFGEEYGKRLLNKFATCFVYSGWPRVQGYIDLNTSCFYQSIQRKLLAPSPDFKVTGKTPQLATSHPLRIGCFGRFSGLLSFPERLFAVFPDDAELFIFDIRHRGKFAEYLETSVTYYKSVELDNADSYQLQLREVATAINNSELDILINVNWTKEAYDLLDVIETFCIINICTGSDILHHNKVSFQIYCQPEVDYFVQNKHLFCALSRTQFNSQLVYSGYIFYDSRDIENMTTWTDREPLIIFHGSLYKLASLSFLTCIFNLMQADRELEFVFMGKDNGTALNLVSELASRLGLDARVHYEGEFSAMRDKEGCILDPGWLKMLTYLKRARLAPNPWPIGGGSSRFESYVAGVPSVHMGVKFDPTSWGRPQHALFELPALLVPEGTATSIEQYEELCRQCLYDEMFAEHLVTEQLKIVRKLGDPGAYWQQIFGFYQDWLENEVQLNSG